VGSKVLVILLSFMVFMGAFSPYYYPAHAIGVDTAVKLLGGKAIVRALAEKAGMALSSKQIDNVAGVIAKKTYEGDIKTIDFVNKANALTPGVSSRSGFKKYVLDPMFWLTGLDLIFGAVAAFQTGFDGGTPVSTFGDCIRNPLDSVTYPYWIMYQQSSYEYLLEWQNPAGVINVNGEFITGSNLGNLKLFKRSYSGQITATNWTNISTGKDTFSANGVSGAGVFASGSSGDCVKDVPIASGDLVNITNVDNSTKNYFDNDTYNTTTIYNVEVDVPDNINYGDTIVWNLPDTNIIQEVIPPDSDGDGIPDVNEPDTDGDGIIDDTDITPNGDTDLPIDDVPKSLWDKLFPVLLIIKLFGVLGSCLMYLIRMFQFIMTIPGIDAIPIDNPAFVWFRTTQIIGINIYDVVSSLAGVGLSFIVFRAIRRAFL
jgi:hypothetical protein